jgi:hypothetical protein
MFVQRRAGPAGGVNFNGQSAPKAALVSMLWY